MLQQKECHHRHHRHHQERLPQVTPLKSEVKSLSPANTLSSEPVGLSEDQPSQEGPVTLPILGATTNHAVSRVPS